MKLLENIDLEALGDAISVDNGEYNIEGRIESYSCKMASMEKRLFKTLNEGRNPKELQALSPPMDSQYLNNSPIYHHSSGSDSDTALCDTISTRILFNLISTLNASFPDYDFSDAKSCEFNKETDKESLLKTVDTYLPGYSNELKEHMWSTIDKEISLQHCIVYSYNPDLDSDPFGECGLIWTVNYFFYNDIMKRLVFLTLRASRSKSDGEFLSDDEETFKLDY